MRTRMRWCAALTGITTLVGLLTVPPAKAAAALTRSSMDIDGDGKDELVVGGFLSAGYGVVVTYSGLGRRDHLTAPIPSGTRPNFGDVLTSGDFNGDGYADLAIANPGEHAPRGGDPAFAGGVWVYYGGADGLDRAQPQHINQGTDGVPGTMMGGDQFGAALAAGDINGDGRDDLAVGSPGEVVDAIGYAGSVTVLFGGTSGLTVAGVQSFAQGTGGVPDVAETNDAFGNGLAIGDVTQDGYADVAIAATGEDGGRIMLLRGGPGGVTTGGVTSIAGHQVGVGALGEFMSIADIDGDGDGDLVASAPRSGFGYIAYVPGFAAGLDVARSRVISMETPGIPGDPYGGPGTDSLRDRFGYALATGDVTGDGRADVLTAAKNYDHRGIVDAGAVYLIPGQPTGLTGAGTLMLTQQAPALVQRGRTAPDCLRPQARNYFGEANTILNLDGVGALDMVTATSFENLYSGYDAGVVMELGLRYAAGRPAAGAKRIPASLFAKTCRTGARFGAYNVGHTLLHR